MSVKDKVLGLIKRYGTPAKFATKLVLGAVLPGKPAVVELVGQVLDCVHETAKDNAKEDKLPPATAKDLERVEQVLDVLNGDLATLMAQVAELEDTPAVAARVLDVALATDARCQSALHKLDELGRGFDRLEQQNVRMLQDQGYAIAMLEEMLPLLRRAASVADFVADLSRAGAPLADFRTQLQGFQKGARAFSQGHLAEAGALLLGATQALPSSGAAATTLAAVQAAEQNFPEAEKTLARASRLRPGDAELAELSRRVTAVTGATPSGAASPSVRATTAIKVGDVLDGWRLEQLLGRGGWGQVFRARRGNEVRALKVMRPDLSRDPLFESRFKGEIGTLYRLSGQKHLVEIHDFGYSAIATCWYLVMELIEGPSLEQHLRRRGALPLSEAFALFAPLAEALGVAHARGIVHRDIKPDNIQLCQPDDRPVLVDFGLAALVDGPRLTQTGGTAGHTPMFAAPEQLRGKPADARSDVYSLAASLYYALTYDKPHHREPDSFEPEHAPEALRAALESALHYRPERRPANAAAFAAQLRIVTPAPRPAPLARGAPLPTRPVPPHPVGAPVPAPNPLPPVKKTRMVMPHQPGEVEVTVPGEWRVRAAGQPEGAWETLPETARVTIRPGYLYELQVARDATDGDLSGLAQLSGLTSFQSLGLAFCERVTDAGLAHLRGLTSLQSLSFARCERVTDAGLAHVRGLPRLQSLNLRWCKQVTDTGLAHLRDLTSLQALDLAFCDVTDAGLAHLHALPSLQSLTLGGCNQVTDVGLAHLHGLRLQSLDLWGCAQVTNAGLAALRAALPACRVNR